MSFWRYAIKESQLSIIGKCFSPSFRKIIIIFAELKQLSNFAVPNHEGYLQLLFFIFKLGSYTMSPSSQQNRERKKPNPPNFNLHSLHSWKTFVKPAFVNVVESLASWRGLGIQTGRIRVDGIIRFGFLPQCYLQCSPLHLQKQKDL